LVLGGHCDFDVHDRLEDLWLGALISLLERISRGDLEGHSA